MHQVIRCAGAALLVATTVQPATADDRSVCLGIMNADKRTFPADSERIAACNRLLAVNPNDADAYIGRGRVYSGKRDYDRAIADANEAIRLNPTGFSFFFNRG